MYVVLQTTTGSYLSLIIDGADQRTYALPYFCDKPHGTEVGLKLKNGLYGVLVHGGPTGLFALPGWMKGGSNTTVHCLHKMFWKLSQDAPNGRLPPHLFLQMDNTCKENKNYAVLVRYTFLL